MEDVNKLRKRIYVDRHVQGGIVLRLMFLWFASTLLAVGLAVLLQYLANPTVGLIGGAGSLLFPLLMALAATLPIAVLHLLRFTHRFAGPVVRLRHVLGELASGREVKRLKFRDHDYWQDLADEVNTIATELSAARKRVLELESLVAKRDSQSVDHVDTAEQPVVAV